MIEYVVFYGRRQTNHFKKSTVKDNDKEEYEYRAGVARVVSEVGGVLSIIGREVRGRTPLAGSIDDTLNLLRSSDHTKIATSFLIIKDPSLKVRLITEDQYQEVSKNW